jgi:hypothetical protein
VSAESQFLVIVVVMLPVLRLLPMLVVMPVALVGRPGTGHRVWRRRVHDVRRGIHDDWRRIVNDGRYDDDRSRRRDYDSWRWSRDEDDRGAADVNAHVDSVGVSGGDEHQRQSKPSHQPE